MKTFVLLLFAAITCAYSQSDCGNCWIIWGGCDPTAICDVNGLCQVCVFWQDCDDTSCRNGPHWICQCPNVAGVACNTQRRALVGGPKTIIAKQKEKNSAQLKKVAWYRWSPFWDNTKHR